MTDVMENNVNELVICYGADGQVRFKAPNPCQIETLSLSDRDVTIRATYLNVEEEATAVELRLFAWVEGTVQDLTTVRDFAPLQAGVISNFADLFYTFPGLDEEWFIAVAAYAGGGTSGMGTLGPPYIRRVSLGQLPADAENFRVRAGG